MGENVMETDRGAGKQKELGADDGHVSVERHIMAERWAAGSDDTGGRTSRGYVQEKERVLNVVNLHIQTDRIAEKMAKDNKYPESTQKVRDSLQCDASYQKLVHTS